MRWRSLMAGVNEEPTVPDPAAIDAAAAAQVDAVAEAVAQGEPAAEAVAQGEAAAAADLGAEPEAEPERDGPGALLEALARNTPRRPPTYRDQPARRPLRIYSFDPMLANTLERVGPGVVTVEIPWEPLWFGPRGTRVVVTDYDSSRRINDKPAPGYYEPAKSRPDACGDPGRAPAVGE